jgi:multidrug resistance efflux pump
MICVGWNELIRVETLIFNVNADDLTKLKNGDLLVNLDL